MELISTESSTRCQLVVDDGHDDVPSNLGANMLERLWSSFPLRGATSGPIDQEMVWAVTHLSKETQVTDHRSVTPTNKSARSAHDLNIEDKVLADTRIDFPQHFPSPRVAFQ